MKRCWMLVMLVCLLGGCGAEPAPPEAALPCTTVGETWTRPADGMTMVCVPAGEFSMGSSDGDPEAYGTEKPQHTVFLDAYWIDRTEVTNAQYQLCIDSGACTLQDYREDERYNAGDQPVAGVTWEQARAYATWAGGRLPTEAEWEKAARGTDGRLYPWGDTAPDCALANASFLCLGRTAVAGSYPGGASPYGTLDMAGNVWEWVNDWSSEDYYAGSPGANPQGPDTGAARVMRGGAYTHAGRFARCACRVWYTPLYSSKDVGFRVAASAGASAP